jgi:hypothetical protein
MPPATLPDRVLLDGVPCSKSKLGNWALAKILRTIWGGAIEYYEEDTPLDVKTFNVFGKSVHTWLWQSRGLNNAATAMIIAYAKEYPETKDPFRETIALMLGGYAIEALLKMVVIADHCDQHGWALDTKKAQEFVPTTHDLDKLAGKAKIRTNKADRQLLRHLSGYTTWAGRYPIPLFPTGYDGPAVFNGSRKEQLPPGESKIWKGYAALYAKLHKIAVRKVFGKPQHPRKHAKRR